MKPRPHIYAFGLAVRARREAMNITQEELASRAHLHRTYIGGVERGERNLSYLNVVAIAAALEVGTAQLVGEAERMLKATIGEEK